uniref:BAH domain-containing protein n=1 Tax=Mesocestoides corti TaxID=53468 RepID=A0A5K3G017_MESCO
MTMAAINNSDLGSNAGDEDTAKSALTPDENSRDSHQNNGSSTPEPPAAVKEVPLRRSNRGKGRPDRSNHSDERMQSCLCGSVEYKPGDYVYYEEAESDYYAIGLIDEIKMSRRDKCNLIIKSFWRTGDVPEVSKQALLDREDTDSGDPRILARELFVTEHQSTIYSSLLRGKCSVVQMPDLCTALKTFNPEVEDSFFYVYAYNPETKRLLSTRAEIKIGPAYQATWLPPCRGLRPLTHRCAKHNSILKRLRETQNTATSCPHSPPAKRAMTAKCCCSAGDSSHCEHVCLQRVDENPPKQWEQLVWLPDALNGAQDEDWNCDDDEDDDEDAPDRPLKTYLDAVRSLVAIFAFGGSDDDLVSAENGHVLANLAATTQHAYDTLHACNYNLMKALEAVKANPIVSTV